MEKGISASKPGLFYAACAICQVMYCSSPAALLPFPDAWRGVTVPGFRSLQKRGESLSPMALGLTWDQAVLRMSSFFLFSLNYGESTHWMRDLWVQLSEWFC